MLENVAEAKKLREMVLATNTLCGTNVSVESLEKIILRVAETTMHMYCLKHMTKDKKTNDELRPCVRAELNEAKKVATAIDNGWTFESSFPRCLNEKIKAILIPKRTVQK